jgi:hypothetical protein
MVTHTSTTTMMIQRKQSERRPERRMALLVLLLLHSCCWDWQLVPPRSSASGTAVQAFTPPLYGLAGLVNPVRNGLNWPNVLIFSLTPFGRPN